MENLKLSDIEINLKIKKDGIVYLIITQLEDSVWVARSQENKYDHENGNYTIISSLNIHSCFKYVDDIEQRYFKQLLILNDSIIFSNSLNNKFNDMYKNKKSLNEENLKKLESFIQKINEINSEFEDIL